MKQVEDFLKKHQQPAYRLEQFNRHYYQQYVSSFAEITTFSKDLRNQLSQEINFSSLELEKVVKSPQGKTLKALFSLKRKADYRLETVLMRHEDGRNTVCLSCMVGCPVGCSFCATGQMGLKTKLTTQEIVDQVLFFARWLKEKDEKITNIVYMGMGEPLLNLEAVEESIDIIIDSEKMGFSQRRLTLSTAGYAPQIKRLVDDGYDQLKLAVSLHAANQELREKIIPVARVYNLDELFSALDYYVERCNKLVSYEYILLAGLNDSIQDAQKLSQLLAERLAHVNLIPYNPIQGVNYKTPTQETVKKFAQILTKEGISNSIRVTMGAEIEAACGQLSSS